MARKNYSVGYKRPPVETRFQPGESGNPAGRPKGRRNLQTLLKKCLEDEVEVSAGNKRKSMTVLEALLRRLLNKALSGDLKALAQALNLARTCEANDAGESIERDPTQEAQQLAIIRQILNGATPPSPREPAEG